MSIVEAEILVDRVLRANEAADGRLKLMLVTGAGTSIATCWGQETSAVASWPGLIKQGLLMVARHARVGDDARRAWLNQQAERCNSNAAAEVLLELCDILCEAFRDAGLKIDDWIHSVLCDMDQELRTRMDGGATAPLLDAIRDWREAFGAIVATTNYDHLLTTAGCGEPIALSDEEVIADPHDAFQKAMGNAHNVIHLHGRYDRTASAVFSSTDYHRLIEANTFENCLARRLFSATLPIFIGCGAGLADDDISALIGERRIGGKSHLREALVLQLADDTSIPDLKLPPFEGRCRGIVYGAGYDELAPFLNDVRQRLVDRGFGQPLKPRATIRAQRWLKARNERRTVQSRTTPCPPIVADETVTELPLRRFFGTVLSPLVPDFELQTIDAWAAGPEAAQALHEDARFEEVPVQAILSVPLSVVLGDGGSGKTTLLQLLDQDLLKQQSGFTPFYVRAADYLHARRAGGKAAPSDLWSHLIADLAGRLCAPADQAPALDAPPDPDLAAALRAAAADAKLVVIIDGLDEVPSVDDRIALVSEVRRFHDDVKSLSDRYAAGSASNRVIVSSRFSGYRTASITGQTARHFVLSPLAPDQVHRLHDHVFASLIAAKAGPPVLVRRARRMLRRALDEDDFGRWGHSQWIDTPLLALFVAVVFLADIELPSSRVGLYQKIVELSCHYTLERAGEGAGDLDVGQMISLLEAVAFGIFTKSNQDVLSKPSLDAVLAEEGYLNEDALTAVRRTLTCEQSLLRERSSEFFGFVHRGMLEYLCGGRLSNDVDRLVRSSLEARWRQAASFACAKVLNSDGAKPVAEAMADASSSTNGGRPILTLLQGALYAEDLSPAACTIVARATVEGLSRLAPNLREVSLHSALKELLVAMRSDTFIEAFEAEILEILGSPQATSARCQATLILIEGLLPPSAALAAALDTALAGMDPQTAPMAERVQRIVIARLLAEFPTAKPVLDFAQRFCETKAEFSAGAFHLWRRVLLTLAGGLVDLDQPAARALYGTLVRFLDHETERRDMLLFSLAEPLRAVALGQEKFVVEHRLRGSNRLLSRRQALAEQRRRPDIVMGLAIFLDRIGEHRANQANIEPLFDPRAFYRTPRLAEPLLAAINRDEEPDVVTSSKTARAAAQDECALIEIVLGRMPASPVPLDAVHRALRGLADGALRATVFADRARRGESWSDDAGMVFGDAVRAMQLHFGLPVGGPQGRDLELVDAVACALGGIDTDDQVYDAMIFIDRIKPADRVRAFIELGRSRFINASTVSWDLPVPPLPHLHDGPKTILGELIDILEACPPAVSALRSDTLRRLNEAGVFAPEVAMVEIAAALARDWGAQALEDGQIRIAHPAWADDGADALLQARASPASLWKARALIRLLAAAPKTEREVREQEILETISLLVDPFDQALALELLAERGLPAHGEARAQRAFQILGNGKVITVEREGKVTSMDAERLSRAYARLSTWLDARSRRAALRAALALTANVGPPRRQALLLRGLAPYAARDRQALAAWTARVSDLPDLLAAFAKDQPGEMLRLSIDGLLADRMPSYAGQMDPLVAYGLLRDTLRQAGEGLEPWEILERAEITRSGAERVRAAFSGPTPPRMTAAGLLTLREFAEAGMAEVVSFVLVRTPRHPRGAASLLQSVEPEGFAGVLHAANYGIDAANAGAVVEALTATDQSFRPLAIAALDLSSPAQFADKSFQAAQSPYTTRRSTVIGFDALLEIAKHQDRAAKSGGPLQSARWYCGDILMETAAEAHRLAALAQTSTGRSLIAAVLTMGRVATPQFLAGFAEALGSADHKIQKAFLRLLGSTLHLSPASEAPLTANGVLAQADAMLKADPRLDRGIFSGDVAETARFIREHCRIEPETLDQAYAVAMHRPHSDLPSLTIRLRGWAASFVSRFRVEAEPDFRAAAQIVTEDEHAVSTLTFYCDYLARQVDEGDLDAFTTLALQAWPLLAALAERCPSVLRLKMLDMGIFGRLPILAASDLGWIARRSAFLLMPLEWSDGRTRANPDALRAALGAAEDVWMVQEAAMAMAGTVRAIDSSALDQLFEIASTGGMRALMAFRILFAIFNNDQAPQALRRRAHRLIETALSSDIGDKIVEHGILTMGSPPRMRLRDVMLQQAFSAGL